MLYEDFKNRCLAVLKKSGIGGEIKFHNGDGKYVALFPDGVKIVGNSVCSSIRVMWGSGHTAIARI